ncbi:ABC transporter substrate-binding protein [Actinomadura sp. GTD37]|uniref:ABC transporter substrate-binding protein n=1 Tax=Actinomadura sp. GTD37 TaxID=1778030 RepID=UPI0035BF24F2
MPVIRTTTPILACVLIAGLATACGDSESGAASAADSPVTIMVSGTLSSPNLSYPQTATGALAAAQAINKAGGIDGHPIKVVQCNDQLNPSTALACVRKAAREKVVAMVGGIDLFTAQLWPTLKTAGIPWVGIDVISADQATNPMSYPMTGGTVTGFYQAGRLAVQKGGKQVAIVKHENPQATFVAGLIAAGVTSAGGTVAGQIVSKIGNSDPAPAAAQAIGKRPDAIACACNAGDGARILKAVRQAGFSKVFTAGYPTLLETDIQNLGRLADNTYTPSDIADPGDPKAAMFFTQMRDYDPKARRDGISAGAWLGTYAIAQVLKGQTPLTSATLIRRLNTVPAIATHGLTGGSISFAKPGPLPQYPRITDPYVIDYVAADGKRTPVSTSFVSVYGGE